MDASLNKVMLIGRLGKDVVSRKFDNGDIVAMFSLATTSFYTDKNNKRVENTQWHNIVARKKLAEICIKYLNKGDQIFIEGSLQTRKWEENDISRYTTEVIANKIEFLKTKKSNLTPDWGISEEDLPF